MNAEIINVPDKLLVIATDVHSVYPHCAAKTFANAAGASGRRRQVKGNVCIKKQGGNFTEIEGMTNKVSGKCEMKDRTPR